MASFQLDSLSALPGLDPAALVARPEPRRDDSFEEHLRRAESAPAKREDQPPPVEDSAPAAAARPDESRATREPSQPAGEATEPAKKAENKTSQSDEKEKPEEKPLEVNSAVVEIRPVPVVAEEIAEVLAVAEAAVAQLGDEELATTPGKTPLAKQTQLQALSENAAVEESLAEIATPEDETSPEVKTTAEPKVGVSDAKPEPHKSQLENAAKPQAAEGLTTAVDSGSTTPLPAAPATSESSTGRRERNAGVKTAERQSELAATPGDAAEPQAAEIVLAPAALLPAAEEARAGSDAKPTAVSEAPSTPATPDAAVQQGRLPPHVLGRAGERDAPLRPLTEVDQARFVNRVARAFQTAAGQEGELRLRLSPPELGALRLEVKVLSGVMTARIETETNAARALLVENLPMLRERLAEQNIRLEQFDIDLMNRQDGGQPSGTPQESGREAFGSADASARFSLADESPEEQPAPRAVRPAGNGQLNVLV